MDQQRSDLYEPGSRLRHVATSVSDGSTSQVIMWGGETPEFYSNDGRIQLASVVEQFDVHSEVWCQRHTLGSPHPGLSSAACTSLGNYIFAYGGCCDDGYSNMSGVLSCLNVKTLTWSQLCPAETAGGPMGKDGCGMVQFSHDKLAVIGGYGFPTGPTQPGSSFIRDTEFTERSGWTNEIHVFDLSQGVWFSPTVGGTRPPPCCRSTLLSIDNHRAVLFGGYQPGHVHGHVSDLYLIDFNTMESIKVEPREGEPWPVGRATHAACCLGYAGDHIHLLVTGGSGGDGMILKDSWLFNLSLKKWKEVTLPDGILPRRLHSTTAITLCPGLVEVIVFGGTTDDYAESKLGSSYSRIAETTIITFGLIGSEWEVMGVASNNKRTASERVREKMLLKSGTDTQGLQLSSTLDCEVTPYALYRLERGGVQVRREISSKNKDFQAVLRQKQPDANLAMIKWTNSVHQTSLKPTWKTLLSFLRLIDLDDLAEQINTYLSGGAVKQLSAASKEQEKSLSEVFTFAALTQLEKREGIPVLTELEAKNHEFQAVIRVKQPNLSWAIDKWLTTAVKSRIIPTWRNLLLVLRLINLDHVADDIEAYSKKHSLLGIKEDKGGDIEKLGDESLALCDKLKEGGDIEQNVRHLKYKIEILKTSAIEQIKGKTETVEMLLADLKKLEASSILGPAEGTEVIKTEPPSPGIEEFDTSIQVTDTTAVMTTQPLVKKEPLEEYLPSTAAIYSTDIGINTELDMLRMENQQLRSDNQQLKMEIQELKSQPALSHSSGETQPSSSSLTGFRGVEVCGETTVVVTSDPQSFAWTGYGLKLHIPKGCLPESLEQCTISIKASLAGQYEFPENSHLVSAVFWFHCEVKFTKKITLEINHCAESVDCSKLTFVRAVHSQEQLPYTFTVLGGDFTGHSSYGVIELNSFCGVGAVDQASANRRYCGNLLYKEIKVAATRYVVEIYFIVLWDTEAHNNVILKHFPDTKAGLHPLPVRFQSEQLELKIQNKIEAWNVTSLITPVVLKKDVDSFKPERRVIPHCHLKAKFSGDLANIPDLECHVDVLGASEPHNKFTIDISPMPEASDLPPPPTVPSSSSTSTKRMVHISQSEGPSQKKFKVISQPQPSDAELENSGVVIKPELPDLMGELCTKAADKWENIGILLRIDDGQLKVIKSNNVSDSTSCLREMLRVWLSRVHPPPSWSAIAGALERLGDENLADDLRSKYCN